MLMSATRSCLHQPQDSPSKSRFQLQILGLDTPIASAHCTVNPKTPILKNSAYGSLHNPVADLIRRPVAMKTDYDSSAK